MWTFLLAGLAMSGIGGLFIWKQELRLPFFRAINPALKPALTAKLSAGLIGAGTCLLLVFLFAVLPYPHSRPYWIVVLSLILSPLGTLGFAAIILVTFFKRGN